jgi:hypothetical protein
MEQNEQLPEREAPAEQGENIAAKIFDDQTAETPVAEGENKETQIVTCAQATIKIEGQEFELEAALAQDDKMLKTILQPLYSSIENANITREIKDGKLTVRIVKRAQHKGA